MKKTLTLSHAKNFMGLRLLLRSMMQRHERLEAQLRSEQRALFPNPTRLARLKKRRLAIKDRIAELLRYLQRQPSSQH